MDKKKEFVALLKKVEKKYGKSEKRLAAEGWKEAWQILIATIMSAQSRDETTIPIAEKLFDKYKNLESLAKAKQEDVLIIFKSLNYNKTKSKNVIMAAKFLMENFKGKVSDDIEDLVKIAGVGRKTANLILSEVHGVESITVDTHVHRICNVFGFVKTKNANETELELRKIVPRKYWSRINRLFVLWGKEVYGRDRNKFMEKLN